MRVLFDTSVLIAADSPGDLEGGISAASLAELHFGVLATHDDDERARRAQRLGVVEATFDPFPIDAAVAREWGRRDRRPRRPPRPLTCRTGPPRRTANQDPQASRVMTDAHGGGGNQATPAERTPVGGTASC